MAMAKAVVSTPIGAEGLPFQDNKQIRIAEYARDFADAVVELLENARLRNEMARAARREVTENYSWEAVVAKVEDVLRLVTSPGKPGRVGETTRDARSEERRVGKECRSRGTT